MRRATVTIPEELEGALESYRRDLELTPSLAAVMQAALKEYLSQRGYVSSEVYTTRARPSMYEDAPTLKGESSAAKIVVEDRS
jgi:hypothetical protein